MAERSQPGGSTSAIHTRAVLSNNSKDSRLPVRLESFLASEHSQRIPITAAGGQAGSLHFPLNTLVLTRALAPRGTRSRPQYGAPPTVRYVPISTGQIALLGRAALVPDQKD